MSDLKEAAAFVSGPEVRTKANVKVVEMMQRLLSREYEFPMFAVLEHVTETSFYRTFPTIISAKKQAYEEAWQRVFTNIAIANYSNPIAEARPKLERECGWFWDMGLGDGDFVGAVLRHWKPGSATFMGVEGWVPEAQITYEEGFNLDVQRAVATVNPKLASKAGELSLAILRYNATAFTNRDVLHVTKEDALATIGNLFDAFLTNGSLEPKSGRRLTD